MVLAMGEGEVRLAMWSWGGASYEQRVAFLREIQGRVSVMLHELEQGWNTQVEQVEQVEQMRRARPLRAERVVKQKGIRELDDEQVREVRGRGPITVLDEPGGTP